MGQFPYFILRGLCGQFLYVKANGRVATVNKHELDVALPFSTARSSLYSASEIVW